MMRRPPNYLLGTTYSSARAPESPARSWSSPWISPINPSRRSAPFMRKTLIFLDDPRGKAVGACHLAPPSFRAQRPNSAGSSLELGGLGRPDHDRLGDNNPREKPATTLGSSRRGRPAPAAFRIARVARLYRRSACSKNSTKSTIPRRIGA